MRVSIKPNGWIGQILGQRWVHELKCEIVTLDNSLGNSTFLCEHSDKEITLLLRFECTWEDYIIARWKWEAASHLPRVDEVFRSGSGFVVEEKVLAHPSRINVLIRILSKLSKIQLKITLNRLKITLNRLNMTLNRLNMTFSEKLLTFLLFQEHFWLEIYRLKLKTSVSFRRSILSFHISNKFWQSL